MDRWFDDPVLGNLPPREAAVKLREVGEDEAAELLEESETTPFDTEFPDQLGLGCKDLLEKSETTRSFGFTAISGRRRWPFQDKPWQHTTPAYGYLAPAAPGSDPLPIYAIGNIAADSRLKDARVKITLSRLRAASYPGKGMHRVLLHVSAQNQVPGKAEDVHFNATYRVWDGDHAGVQGYPLFVGLCVGSEGLSFKCRTINVSNDQDEAFLDFLESDVFKAGLKLATVAQPVIAPFSELAFGLATMIGKRHRNVAVQDIGLGLDFGANPMGGRLAEGDYLAVQTPESLRPIWNWEEWVYHPKLSKVVKCDDYQQTIPYNYLVFSVSRYEGP